jgi:hypothetical protein
VKLLSFLIAVCIALISFNCTGSRSSLTNLTEPLNDRVLVIGNVIVENIDQGLQFDTWDFPCQVVIIGKTTYSDTLSHYTISTDDEGYFALENVPDGIYGLKAVIVPLFGSQPLKLVNPLESPKSQFYRMRHPEQEIEYTALYIPGKEKNGIVNLNITWLGLRSAEVEGISGDKIGVVVRQISTEKIENKQFWTNGVSISRDKPLDYMKKKFPQSGWWKHQ